MVEFSRFPFLLLLIIVIIVIYVNKKIQNEIKTALFKKIESFLFKKIKIKLEDLYFLKNFIDLTFRYS